VRCGRRTDAMPTPESLDNTALSCGAPAPTAPQRCAVSFNDEMGSSCDLVGIDVPKSLLVKRKEKPIMQNDTRISVDVAKAVLEVAVSDRPGHVTKRERLVRERFLPFMAQQPPALVVMEACGSAHYWARKLQVLGHRVRLLPPHHVRPYVRRNKTDRAD